MVDATESWRPVLGYEGLYEVSDLGRVRSIPRPGTRGGVMRTWPNIHGYLSAGLRRDGCPNTQFNVHALVAEAFIGPRPADAQVRHFDGDQRNNAASNLLYGTQSENELDKVRHGRNRNSAKAECPHGHPYDKGNTIWRATGGRRCRTCDIERKRANRRAA